MSKTTNKYAPEVCEQAVRMVLAEIIRRFPPLRHVFADGGYAGDELMDTLRRIGKWTIGVTVTGSR